MLNCIHEKPPTLHCKYGKATDDFDIAGGFAPTGRTHLPARGHQIIDRIKYSVQLFLLPCRPTSVADTLGAGQQFLLRNLTFACGLYFG